MADLEESINRLDESLKQARAQAAIARQQCAAGDAATGDLRWKDAGLLYEAARTAALAAQADYDKLIAEVKHPMALVRQWAAEAENERRELVQTLDTIEAGALNCRERPLRARQLLDEAHRLIRAQPRRAADLEQAHRLAIDALSFDRTLRPQADEITYAIEELGARPRARLNDIVAISLALAALATCLLIVMLITSNWQYFAF